MASSRSSIVGSYSSRFSTARGVGVLMHCSEDVAPKLGVEGLKRGGRRTGTSTSMSTECKRVSKAALSLAGIIIFLLNVALGQAQDWAKARLNNSPRHGEWVEIKSGDRTIKAFVVYPERKDK